jgi:tripartite-type tricarboxylate transporter receptor subunit TctC
LTISAGVFAGAVNDAAQHPDLRDSYIKGGNAPANSTPDEFAARIRTDHAKWGKIISAAGIKAE